MRNPYKKNLPSITARPEQPGNERSGALSTTKITEEAMPDLVRDMLMLARIKDNEELRDKEVGGTYRPQPRLSKMMKQR